MLLDARKKLIMEDDRLRPPFKTKVAQTEMYITSYIILVVHTYMHTVHMYIDGRHFSSAYEDISTVDTSQTMR